jgi:hypothetical protein
LRVIATREGTRGLSAAARQQKQWMAAGKTADDGKDR